MTLSAQTGSNMNINQSFSLLLIACRLRYLSLSNMDYYRSLKILLRTSCFTRNRIGQKHIGVQTCFRIAINPAQERADIYSQKQA